MPFWYAIICQVNHPLVLHPKQRCLSTITNKLIKHKPMTSLVRLMEEILHHLIGSLSHYFFAGFDTSQVVQDFFHQQYDNSINEHSIVYTLHPRKLTAGSPKNHGKIIFHPPPFLGSVLIFQIPGYSISYINLSPTSGFFKQHLPSDLQVATGIDK